MKNLLKSKTAMSLLLIGLAAIIIGGATQAWFTDEAEVADATFTAGTVVVDAEGPTVGIAEDKYIDNINPGDCARLTWTIANTGTKAAELRAKIDYEWDGVELGDVDPFYFCPPEGSPWVMYEEDTDEDGKVETWLYYTGGPVRGTYNPDGEPLEPETVDLVLVVGFDGPDMDNDFQGAGLRIGGIVEAIQASNGAPEAEWGEAFTNANKEDYTFLNLRGANYFYNDRGNDMPCWDGDENEEEEEEEEKYEVTIIKDCKDGADGTFTGDGSYEAGDAVTASATPDTYWYWDGWHWRTGTYKYKWYERTAAGDPNQWTERASNSDYVFTMPAEDVELKVEFYKY